jgi:UDP-hydrolysing UDP-N-acetyl-D-glucosamine 2-epimerase
MSNKRKVCVVITARPSYSRVKTALRAIDEHPELELQLVVVGSALLSKYGSSVDFIEQDGFKIAMKVHTTMDGDALTTMAKSTGVGIMELSSTFYHLKPDIVLTIADRFETMSTAIAASYMNIPLAHLQGGEVTGNIDEKVRHAITKLSDIHLVSSADAYERVIKMGEETSTVHLTGCPSIDLAKNVEGMKLDFDPYEKYKGVGAQPNWKDGYVVVLMHPVTTHYETAFEEITNVLKAVERLNKTTFWFWPNVDAGSDGTSKGIRVYRENSELKNFHFFKNMERTRFP